MMSKKFLSILIILISFNTIFSQTWQSELKPGANYSDIQKAFEKYWDNKSVPYNEIEGKEEGEYLHFKRWENFMKDRIDSTGHFPSYQLINEYNKINRINSKTTATAANWDYIGAPNVPGYGGGAGRINTIEFDPTNSNTIWVGAPNGGLWKTTNGGTSWTTNTDFLANISIADIEINALNTNIMYIATGDNSGYGPLNDFWGGTYSAGVLKSIDGGATWSTTGLSYLQTNNNIIQKIVLFQNNPSILLAANRTSIMRTTDGGATWTNVLTNHVYDFEIDPSDPNTVYAVGNGKFLKSTDQGLTWTSLTLFSSASRKMSIAISPSLASTIYVLDEDGNLYKSINSGLSFTSSAVTGVTLYGYYDCVLAVSPTNVNEVYVAGYQIMQSMDGGITWNRVGDDYDFSTPDYVHCDNHYIEFLPGSATTLFSCNDGGIFKSTNNGATWNDLSNNLAIAQYYRIATAQSLPSRYYLGQQDNGTVVADAGVFEETLGGDGMDCLVDPVNPDRAIVSYQYGSFYSTTDNWSTYNDISIGMASGAWITPIQLDPVDPNTIYAAYDDLYMSNDFGLTWNSIGTFAQPLEALAIAQSNHNYIYTSYNNNLYKTSDYGATWSNTNPGLPSSNFIKSIAVSNLDPKKAWVTYGGYTSGSKVYMTTNGGASWTNFSGSLPNIPCNTIVHQKNSSDELYVGTDFGVYYRNETMTDWIPFQTNLPNVIINELEIVPSLNTIRAATYGRGVWQSPLYNNINLDGLKENSEFEQSFSIFPNPTSGIFNISSSLINNVTYKIKITDALGNIIFEDTSNKINQYKFDLSNYASGVYSITISNNLFIATKKMVLNK